ncbi:unnamed protein product [Cladocopium goreaui]|uniref:Uncharacterized protein n=1 Tax=Cladocopium goreaui TaxID=2562237 RepID=A0A9P1FM22_9DINO|nr:unnamed protein product [Cladocopium goreaui]|mmetsp:Transcript_61960/g.135701  ORF Transcript_61960/g.135701 Transcript_61960/m.135701 type:complete len:135 (-) Transcript_61960:89-493(-)
MLQPSWVEDRRVGLCHQPEAAQSSSLISPFSLLSCHEASMELAHSVLAALQGPGWQSLGANPPASESQGRPGKHGHITKASFFWDIPLKKASYQAHDRGQKSRKLLKRIMMNHTLEDLQLVARQDKQHLKDPRK